MVFRKLQQVTTRRPLLGRVALVAALICSAAAAIWCYPQEPRERGEPVLILRDNYIGIILPRNCLLPDRQTTWEPTARDVERAERRLWEFLGFEDTGLGDRLGEYARQYFGITVGGHRIVGCIFVHRLATAETPARGIDDCLRRMGTPAAPFLSVERGDDDFRLKYDPETDRCSELHVWRAGELIR
jgi:hypothetical protein